MARTGRYTTKQGDTVLSYLASLGNSYITVEELSIKLAHDGNHMGLATIYRQLDKLEREGKVHKLFVDGIAGACYRYLCDDYASALHLMCNGCGVLLDLDCHEVDGFERHLLRHHKFNIDTSKTVLYGKCQYCAVKKQ